MAKIIILGDIHGHDSWQGILEKEKDADKFIFIGDYWDSFGMSFLFQLHNFKKLIDKKKELGEKMILLLGNHDFSYWQNGQSCSGYQPTNAPSIRLMLSENKELFKIAHREGDILFTHAGVSKTWFESIITGTKSENVEDVINEKFEKDPTYFWFTGRNPYGDDITQGPLWIRPRSLKKDKIAGFIQVVGHTHFDEVTFDSNIWFIDALPNQYLTIEDGILRAENV